MTRVRGVFDGDDPSWKEAPSQQAVRQALQDIFNRTALALDEKADALKSECMEMVTVRLSAAQPEVILGDVEKLVTERIDQAFAFGSHQFERRMRDLIARAFQGDGRASHARRMSLVDEIWRRGK